MTIGNKNRTVGEGSYFTSVTRGGTDHMLRSFKFRSDGTQRGTIGPVPTLCDTYTWNGLWNLSIFLSELRRVSFDPQLHPHSLHPSLEPSLGLRRQSFHDLKRLGTKETDTFVLTIINRIFLTTPLIHSIANTFRNHGTDLVPSMRQRREKGTSSLQKP